MDHLDKYLNEEEDILWYAKQEKTGRSIPWTILVVTVVVVLPVIFIILGGLERGSGANIFEVFFILLPLLVLFITIGAIGLIVSLVTGVVVGTKGTWEYAITNQQVLTIKGSVAINVEISEIQKMQLFEKKRNQSHILIHTPRDIIKIFGVPTIMEAYQLLDDLMPS
ncbi:MAG: hypothetical protein GY810_00775 [Aureispira sp.]|nr:hypothetical protein [Aureispira sp.]